MAVTTLSNKTSKKTFIDELIGDYPQFKFEAGSQEHWSPKQKKVTYNLNQTLEQLQYGVLHELAHALLDHHTYGSDFELLQLEGSAWDLAQKIAAKYEVLIDEDHIQDCLDTYRDWLHRRSSCPNCGTHVFQQDSSSYHCYNCQTIWQVTSGRFVRSYRKRLN